MSVARWLALGLLLSPVAGCVVGPEVPEGYEPVTVVNEKLSDPEYWWNKSAEGKVVYRDFDKLYAAAERASRDLGFRPDRINPRGGELFTEPLVSKQFFEIWRSDVLTHNDMLESSLSTVRRTVRFEIEKLPTGEFELQIKVLVERNARRERRLTNAVFYRRAFFPIEGIGSREEDRGLTIPIIYWYPIDRDDELEIKLAIDIERLLPRTFGP